MKKNIVILRIENGNPSGVVRYLQMLTEGMKQVNEVKIHIICLNTNLIFPQLEMVDDKVIANIPYPSKSKVLGNETYWLTKYFNVVYDLLFPYFENREQLIWHIQELFLIKLAHMLKCAFGGYILTHLHVIPWKLNIEYNEKYFKQLYSQWINNIFDLISKNQREKVAYPLSDKIICVSYSAMKHIISAYGIPSEKISVIYNGLNNAGIFKQERKEKMTQILFVGRISREKGVIGLLNALNKVYSRGYFYKLKLVGQCTGQMLSHIRKSYKELNIEISEAVSFNELKKLYSESTIGVIPSLHEQCSYVGIEMSMFGMPMIVSDVDALSEMFEDGVNALKVPLIFDEDLGLEIDEDKLADAIVRLIDDKHLRQKLGENAIMNYHKKFTLEKMIKNTVDVYEQLIEQNNA